MKGGLKTPKGNQGLLYLPEPRSLWAALTCRKKRSASAALPAAMHWKDAFWPALTSTSPRREKWGAFAVGKQAEPQHELGLRALQAGAKATLILMSKWTGTHHRDS